MLFKCPSNFFFIVHSYILDIKGRESLLPNFHVLFSFPYDVYIHNVFFIRVRTIANRLLGNKSSIKRMIKYIIGMSGKKKEKKYGTPLYRAINEWKNV